MVMLHDAVLPVVQAALARYHRAQGLLERQVQASVMTLRAQIVREKAATRRRRR